MQRSALGRFAALICSLFIGLASGILSAGSAYATQFDAVDPASVAIVRTDGLNLPAYVFTSLKISANWSLPDQAAHAGDTFTFALPVPITPQPGAFDLKAADGVTVYGTCQTVTQVVTCTLNSVVEGRSNVGGTIWIQAQSMGQVTTETVDFNVGGTVVKVDLPGTGGIVYNPNVPSIISKNGWFVTTSPARMNWQLMIPGSKVAGLDQITITDTYAMTGMNLAFVNDPTYPRVREADATPYCWGTFAPSCVNHLWGVVKPNPSRVAYVDDPTTGSFTMTIQGPFYADKLYAIDYMIDVVGATTVLPGSEFKNSATINGVKYNAVVSKTSAGGGTGSGETVGHFEVHKVVNATMPTGTTFPVRYSYTMNGTDYSGTLEVAADGTAIGISNLLNGTVVTLTEDVPTIPGFIFGDPGFSGDGVVDGGPSSPSATFTIQGTKRLTLTLTNTATMLVAPAVPSATAGVCSADSSVRSPWTTAPLATTGIVYSDPVTTASADGRVLDLTVTATAAPGYQLDAAALPAGWTISNGVATFTGHYEAAACATPVVPVAPVVTAGVCSVDSSTRNEPTVEVPTVDGITFGTPVVERSANGSVVTVTLTAAANQGYVLNTNALPEGWSVIDGVVTYQQTLESEACATPVVPVAPSVTPAVCQAGSTTPTQPALSLATTDGLAYASTTTTDGTTVTFDVTATVQAGFVLNTTALPAGWTTTATGARHTVTLKQPDCTLPALPRTGAASGSDGGLAVVALAVGALALVVVRRRASA